MTATPVPPTGPSPLLPPDEKFWRRHSPHQEFPLSGVATVLIHLLVLFGIVLVAGVRGCTAEKDRGLPIVADVPGGDDIPNAPSGHRGGDQTGPEVEPGNLPAPPPEAPVPIPRPAPNPPSEPVDEPQRERPQKPGEGEELRRKIGTALQGAGRSPGQGPRTGDGGGPPGNVGNERSQRMVRWTLVLNYSTSEEYLRQLHLLGAQVGFPRPGDEGRVDLVQDLGRRPVSPEPTEKARINRVFWTDAKPASVQGVCQALGVSPAPPYFYAFFPIPLEEEMAQMELDVGRRHGRKRVEDIQSTVFTVTFIGQRPVIEVVKQTGTDGRTTTLPQRSR